MKIIEKVINGIIKRKAFSYYPWDIYLVKKILDYIDEENPIVLDVGCGGGHYSFLFERCGAKVIAFDLNEDFIKKALNLKDENNIKNIEFLVGDGTELKFLNKESMFSIIFMSNFSVFSQSLNKEILSLYLNFLSDNGILVFIWNTNLSGVRRKSSWMNWPIDVLKDFFINSNCKIRKIYFYDRHIFGKFLKEYSFTSLTTKISYFISRITGLPCNLVIIVSKN